VVQAAVLARVSLIEYLAHIQLDLADYGPLRLQHFIARHVGRARLLDLRALGRVELGRVRTDGQQSREDCQRTGTQRFDAYP
jgi:hypothetical protein